MVPQSLRIFVAESHSRINGPTAEQNGPMRTTKDLMSEPGETRTLDPRIKSALLYRLSYRLFEKCGNQTVNQHRGAKPRRRGAAKALPSDDY
jgi:hypothetical protein